MARHAGEFPLLILDDKEILQYLYSIAFARATLEDIKIIVERNQFNIPGFIGNAQRIGSASEGNPLAVRIRANEYYALYLEGFHNRQAQGVEQLQKFLFNLAERKEQYQQGISKLHELVNRQNAQLLDFFTAAAHTAIKVRTLGTVVMASIGAIAAVTGAAAAAPIALIYIGAKVVGGGGGALAASGDPWASAKGVAIGKFDNGVITVGEASQPVVDHSLSALSKGWEEEVGRQISSKSKVVVQLERQVSAQTKVLAAHARARDIAGTARTVRAMNATNATLQAERQVLQRTVGTGMARTAAAQAFRRGMPIISLANDLVSAYNDYVDDEAKLESRR